MYRREYEVAGRHYEFYFYDGQVAVNVKCHHTPEPRTEETKRYWATLSEKVREKLIQSAWENVRCAWWEHLPEQLTFETQSAGRSGGYVLFSKMTDSVINEMIDDVERTPCERCGGSVMLRDHMAAERMFAYDQLPLPIPYENWDIECAGCKMYYSEHSGLRCTMHLGQLYEPHSYAAHPLDRLEELARAVLKVEKLAAEENVGEMLDDELDFQINWYVDSQEDTGT